MLTLTRIQALASRREHAENSVLTIYLDVDQSNQANLNRGFKTQFRDMLAGAKAGVRTPEEMESFEAAAKRIEDYLVDYKVRGRGLFVVYDIADNFFWGEELDFPAGNRIAWGREICVQPLAVAADEYEPVGIVLLDRENVRLLTMSLGKIEQEIQEKFDGKRTRHTKTVGMDHLGSASRLQRKADEQVRLNLRHVIKDIDILIERHGVQRIILAGSPEITTELLGILSKRLASTIIGAVDIANKATLEQIQNVAAPVAEAFERKTEDAIVENLVTSAAKSRRVVTGLGHTLHAVNESRAWKLVYADGFHSIGYECTECGALSSIDNGTCANCGAPLSKVEDVVERAVDHALRKGARVEVIRGTEAEAALVNAGGIGAFLRTRTASLRAS